MSDSDKTTAAIATAAAIALGAAILLGTGAKPGQAVDVQAVVVECTDAGDCAKVQRLYRCVVGEGTDAGLDCGKLPASAQLVPGTASKPYASKEPAKEIAAAEQGSPCACAPWGVAGCEELRPSRDLKAEPAWGPAPAATVLRPGLWRGAACLPCDCWETRARTFAGSTIRRECRAPAAKLEEKDTSKTLDDPKAEATEVHQEP